MSDDKPDPSEGGATVMLTPADNSGEATLTHMPTAPPQASAPGEATDPSQSAGEDLGGATLMMPPEGLPAEASQSEATVMRPFPSAAPEARAARAPSAEPPPAEQTFIYTPQSPASGGPSLDVDDEPTVKRKNLAGEGKPARSNRPLAGLVDDDEITGAVEPKASKKSKAEVTAQTAGERGARGIQLVFAAMILLVAGVVGLRTVLARVARPSDDDLRLAYPYLQGGRLPNGRSAPPVGEVQFRFQKVVPCHYQRCLSYLVTKRGGMFRYQMVVRHGDDGWEEVPGLSGVR